MEVPTTFRKMQSGPERQASKPSAKQSQKPKQSIVLIVQHFLFITMADNNNDIAGVEGVPQQPGNNPVNTTYVDTKIEEVVSSRPNVRKFSIKFDNFEELPSEKGHQVYSAVFSVFGHEWRVVICPGGGANTSSDGMVGMFISLVSKCSLKFQCLFGIRDDVDSEDITTRQFSCPEFNEKGDTFGADAFVSRGLLVRYHLENGALPVYVSIELQEFIPKNPASSIMLKLFGDESSADVVFEVSEHKSSEGKSKSRKRAKVASTNFYAHRLILQHHSSELASLCATSEGMAPILINDVKAEVFRHLLYYVYGGEISEEEFKTHAKDLVNASDKYGVTNLKLTAELWYVNNTDITIDNVIDNLLHADAMNCALLKEKVMDFIVKNKKEMMERVSFQDVPGNVCKDLLAAMSRHYQYYEEEEEGKDVEGFDTMRIGELRQKVQEKGLEIDGSRDALIAALKEHSSESYALSC